ncbi:MAG: hypothetical protein ACR2PQ_03465 [Myxococcota bacterium]
MSEGPLDQPGRTLSQAFFTEGTKPYREQLRVKEQERAAVDALREASDIDDEALLGSLASLGIRVETLAALTMIPIVEVAWADGHMDSKERQAILSGAESTGIEVDSPSYGLLSLWTEEQPAPALTDAWRGFISALSKELSDEERGRMRDRIVGRARAVAEAAGGFLGVGAVSREERAALEALEQAFSS